MNHLKNIGLWLVFFIPAILIELVCYILAPLVACFATLRMRNDYVKRLGRTVYMPRDYLVKPLYWFQTHDNAVDEWWYGMYNLDHWFKFARDWTQNDYDSSPFVRYYCRLMWLWRNCAYGFHYALFSRTKETPALWWWITGKENAGYWHELQVFKSSFQLQMHVPLAFFGARYISINIGWKAHKQTERLLYANRIISFKKYK